MADRGQIAVVFIIQYLFFQQWSLLRDYAHARGVTLFGDMPICIVHGWHDDVVPVDNSIRFARQCDAELHLIDSDHRLTDNVVEIVAYLKRFIRTVTGELQENPG